MPDRPERIVSLLPSTTEIVHALGAGDRLVGVTFECDHPPHARTSARVVVGGATDLAGLTAAEIDAVVRARADAGDDLYTLHEGALRELDPDLVLTQDLCRVCALPSGTVADALDHLGCRAEVLPVDPATLPDVLASVEQVGAALGEADAAASLVAGLTRRLAAVAAAVAGREPVRVAVVEWVDPPFAAGHWVPDLVAAAGGTELLGVAGQRSRTCTWGDVGAAGPDVVVVAPCGYHLDGAAAQAERVLAALDEVGAAATAVWAVDADGLVVRPGPRLVDGVELLAGVLHPGAWPEPDAAAAVRLR